MTCDSEKLEAGDIVHVRMEVVKPGNPSRDLMPMVRLLGTLQAPFAVSMEKITHIEQRPLQIGDRVIHSGSTKCDPEKGTVMGIGHGKAWVNWEAHSTDCIYPLEKLKRVRS